LSAETHSSDLQSGSRPTRDYLFYLLAALAGIGTGWADIKVGDLLFTALLVLASCMVLGFVRPRRPWRWVVTIGIFIPIMEWFAYFVFTQKPDRAQIYESFLAFMPGIAGAYGGALGRGVVDNLFSGK